MNDVRLYDYVYLFKVGLYGIVYAIKETEEEGTYYCIHMLKPDKSGIYDTKGEKHYSRDDFKLVPSKQISIEDAKAFINLEKTREDIFGEEICNIEYPDGFNIEIEDFRNIVNGLVDGKIERSLLDSFYLDEVQRLISMNDNDKPEIKGFPTYSNVKNNLINIIYIKNKLLPGITSKSILDDIELFVENKDKPLFEREFSDKHKKGFVRYWNDTENEEKPTEEGKILMKKFIEYFCDKDDPEMLEVKGYMCYGKCSEVYDEDWFASRDCFLKLMEISPSRYFANTLGYIYYYGRCNNGVPEYDKAFYYFSIGAAGGVYESMYKQADMFMNGYGVTKDLEIARDIYTSLYSENLKYFLNGDYTCKFADLALRMALINETEYVSLDMTYKYYLEAECAIKLRQDACDMYGDDVVAKNIAKSVDEYKAQIKECGIEFYDNLESIIGSNTLINRTLVADIKSLGENKYEIIVYFEKSDDEENVPCLLVTSMVNNFATLIDKAVIQAKGDLLSESGEAVKTCSIKFDEMSDETLYYKGKPVLDFYGCSFKFGLEGFEY